jgi:hypothetical protein
MTDADGTKKTISGDEISMDMAHEDGQAYAKHVNADGSVVVTTPDGRLEGAHLESDLLPGDVGTKAAGSTGLPSTALGAGTSGGAKLDRLLVTGGVTLTGQNGVKATGDELEVETTEVGQTIVLTGVPAKATDGVSILSGPSITMMPAGQQATVSGAGTLVTTTKAGSGLLPNGAPAAKGQAVSAPLTAGAAKPQPVTITWTQDATLDVNVLDVHGSVDLKTRGDDGADEEATADRMSLTLADKAPTTAPVKNAGATNGPSTRDAADPLNGANMGALGDKQVTAARLIGNAKVHSVLTGADGKLLRMQSMKADEIDNDMIAQTMTVPGPGELGVVDNPPPGQPAAGAKGAGGSTPLTAGGSTGLTTGGSTGLTAGGSVGTPGNSGGTTAFSWSRQLVYDMVKGQATMDGPSATTTAPAKNGGAVLVVHQDRATPPMLTTMSAKQLIATFGTGATAANGAQQLKSMTASGAVQVNVKSRGYIIEGGTLQYDPIAQYIVVKGTDEWPGSVHDAQGLKNSPFSVLDLDEQTGRMKLTGPNGQTDP